MPANRTQLGEQIGARIRDARRAHALALADVARDAEISAATLSRIENGKQPVGAALLVVLAGIIGVPPPSLLCGGDDGAGTGAPRRAEALAVYGLLDAALDHLTAVRNKLEAAQAKARKRGR